MRGIFELYTIFGVITDACLSPLITFVSPIIVLSIAFAIEGAYAILGFLIENRLKKDQ